MSWFEVLKFIAEELLKMPSLRILRSTNILIPI